MMQGALRRFGRVGAGLAVALAAAVARAELHWVVPEPTLASVRQVWKEGSLEERSEDGRRFVSLATDGRAHPALAAAQVAPPADARGRFVRLVVRVRGVRHLAHLEVRVAADAAAESWFSLPVPIYADGEYNFLQDGVWTALTLSFGQAEKTGKPDRARVGAIALMATDDGRGRVEIDVAGAALVDAPAQGVVSFTFDDGYREHLTAIRLLAERGWRGTAYVIPHLVGSGAAYLTRADLDEIARLGSDVAAHDDPPFTQLPAAELEPRVRGIRAQLGAWGFAEAAQHLAYPLGKQEPRRVRPTIARVFTTARLAGSGPETLPPADAQLLRAVNVLDSTPPEQVGAWARRAREEGEWLILMFHWLPERAEKATDYALADYRRVLDEVKRAGVRVAPVTEVWREVAAQVAAQGLFPPRTSLPAAPAR